MEQREIYAAVKGAQIKPSMDSKFALGMVQRGQRNYAVVKGARIKFRRGEYAKDTEHTAKLKRSCLHRPSRQLAMRKFSREGVVQSKSMRTGGEDNNEQTSRSSCHQNT